MSDVIVAHTPGEPHEPERTSMGIDSRKMGVWTFLGSEAMFFGSLITTYVVMRGRSTAGPFPHEALSVPLVAFNTFDLICSSLMMVLALSGFQRGDVRAGRRWLIMTIVLGLVFLGGQAVEFTTLYREGVTLSHNLFGATFFTLTGFHGAHVTIGVIWLLFVLVRAFAGGVTRENHMAVELAGLYWHFVDLVWIIIFTVVYLI